MTVGDNSLVGVNVTLEGAKSSSTKTDSRGRYSFAGLPEGGSYTVTPDGARTNFTPRSHPVKNLSRDVSVDFAGAAPPECTFADEATEERNIKKKFAADWLKLIKGEREKISAEHTPPRDSNVNRGTPPSDNPLIFTPENRGARPSPLRRAPVLRSSARRVEPLHYDIRFPRMCRASVTVTYNVNGRPEALPVLRVECNKVGDDWRCGKNLTR